MTWGLAAVWAGGFLIGYVVGRLRERRRWLNRRNAYRESAYALAKRMDKEGR